MEKLARFILWRLAIALVISAVVTAGSVYFVVDQSLRGMETALTATNSRIDDQLRATAALDTKLDRVLIELTDRRVQSVERAFANARVDQLIAVQLEALAREGRALATHLSEIHASHDGAVELERINDAFAQIADAVSTLIASSAPTQPR